MDKETLTATKKGELNMSSTKLMAYMIMAGTWGIALIGMIIVL